jgi:hypothetical protein
VKALHTPGRVTACFDDRNVVSFAGLVPLLRLAERAGLGRLTAGLGLGPAPGRSAAGANPASKIATIVAGMAVGADSIQDLAVLRHGGLSRLFGGILAPSTLGTFLRFFTLGHVARLQNMIHQVTVNLAKITGPGGLLPGLATGWAFLDMDSSVSEVYGPGKEGAKYSYTKKLSLNILVTTLSTIGGAPIILGTRLRGGNADTRKKASSMLRQAITRAREHGAASLWVRMDSGYYTADLVDIAVRAGAVFSVTAALRSDVYRAIAGIPASAWQALPTKETGKPSAKYQIAETTLTAFPNVTTQRGKKITARLIVRRHRDHTQHPSRGRQGELFTGWRYHVILTNAPAHLPAHQVSHHHEARAGAIEHVFTDLYAGPLAHLPSGRFAANAAWLALAALTHNLLRTLATLSTTRRHAIARIATIRNHLIHIAARTTTKSRKIHLHLPTNWPWEHTWLTIFSNLHTPTGHPQPPPATTH